eukprot:5301442-Prymnesium_polylepis.2
MAWGGGAGAAAKLRMAGVAATLAPVLKAGTPVVDGIVTVGGVEEAAKPLAGCVAMLKLQERPWAAGRHGGG